MAGRVWALVQVGLFVVFWDLVALVVFYFGLGLVVRGRRRKDR